MLRSAESEHPRLTNHEIIFEDFHVIIIPRRYERTDRRTDGPSQTDGRFAVAVPRSVEHRAVINE